MSDKFVFRKPVKYLTNKELLAEINRCKKSFCSFVSEEFEDFDLVVTNLDLVTDEMLEQVCAKMSKDQSKKGQEQVVIVPEGLVVRLMTYDHIPLDPDRKRKSRAANQTHAMTTFPPFKHFVLEVIDGENTFREVGRSHWEGGLDNGWFSPDKGQVSDRMGIMYKMLVDRYSRRGNWRGYCVDAETEALTQRGWVSGFDLSESDIILSYHDNTLKWSKVKSIYRDHEYNGNMFKMTVNGFDALVTPGHKFMTYNGLKEVDYLLEKDRLVLMGEAEVGDKPTIDDAFVEIVGWVITEGSFNKPKDRNYNRVTIYQNEGEYAERIRQCLRDLGERFGEYTRRGNAVAFTLSKNLCEKIADVVEIEGKVPSMEFLLSLSKDQRASLVETMIDADGGRTVQRNSLKRGYSQKNKKHMDFFVSLCTLSGIRTTVKERKCNSFGKPNTILTATLLTNRRNVAQVENIDFHCGKRSGTIKGRGKENHPNVPTVPYRGLVWCPETEYGSFIARRNGCVYLTGNSYLDEMKSLALVQLCQVGLQFDESKSSNPFAFYTTTITNCLGGDTEILTREFGSVKIGDVAGQEVTLLDGNGDWVRCPIVDHGVRETVLTAFQGQGGDPIEVWSTPDHGWVSNKGARVDTSEMHRGKRIIVDDLRPSKKIGCEARYRSGVVHGLIYGDGSHAHNRNSGEKVFRIRVCSHQESLIKYFSGFNVEYPEWANGDPYVGVISFGSDDLKAFPTDPASDLDYLLGFFRGWFAADGCVSKVPTPTLCGDAAEHAWAKQWGPLVGWQVNGFTNLSETTNYGKRIKKSVNMHIRKSSMEAADFLIEQHRSRWEKRTSNHRQKPRGNKYDWSKIEEQREAGIPWCIIAEELGVRENTLVSNFSTRKKINAEGDEKKWLVYGARQTGETRSEKVYCPVVSTTGSFALSSFIHSKNCFTRIFNLEKKNQNIRDDLLISMGAAPSYTRQIESELSQNGSIEPTKIPTKRGRKTAAQVSAEKESRKPID